MKRIIKTIIVIAIVIALGVFLLTVTNNNVEGRTYTGDFTIVEDIFDLNCIIVYHNESKVMYAVSDGHYNSGTFIRLDNADGTPMIYKGEENNE